MKIDATRWSEISILLERALDLEEPARAAWLDNLAGTDGTLEPILRELLAHHASAESADFLHTLPRIDDTPETQESGAATGAIVGPYRLLRAIGRGGMGEVWLAERADGTLKRPIALKLPIVAMPQRALAERFAREREILARLTHPHIARLYDAGIADNGQPYLALEYVEGAPITLHCDVARLDLRARIELFLQALAAVQFAHSNLVLHRDLKPSNILVTPQGEAKLLDFGIAKLLDNGSTVETELTRVGGQALTLDYAAPEQVTGAPLTTAADVYSLGVVLYELLCGERPYRLKRGTRGELEEAIATIDPPPPSRAALSDTAVAARRSTERKLRRGLSGDLDTIVQKALRKAPDDRYGSAEAFAEDLQRYLAGVPVMARPATAWYRTSRFVQRHAVGVSATGAVAVALVVASVVSWTLMQRAQREATIATAVQNFLSDLFRANSYDQGRDKQLRDMTAAELLDRGAANIETSLDDAPAAKASLLRLFGEMYEELGITDRSLSMHEKSVDMAARVYGADSREYALALLEKAWVAGLRDKTTGAPLKMVEQAKGILAVRAPGSEDYAEALYMEAHLLMQSDSPRAVASGEEAVRIIERLGATDKRAAFARMELGVVYRFRGDLPHAATAMRGAITAFERLYGPDYNEVGYLYENLAIVLFSQLRLAEAEESFRRAVAVEEKYPTQRTRGLAIYRLQLALLLAARGNYAEAYAEMDAVEQLRAGATDGYGLSARQVQVVRGVTRVGQGDIARGMAEMQAAFTDPAAFPARTMVTVPVLHEYLSRGYLADGDVVRARAEIDEARAAAAKEGINPVRGLAIALRNAEITAREGRADTAVADIDAAVQKAGVAGNSADMQTQIALARARVALAGGHPEQVVQALEPWLGKPLPAGVELPVAVRGEMQLLAGESLLVAQPAAARARLLEAEASLKASEAVTSPRRTRISTALARIGP